MKRTVLVIFCMIFAIGLAAASGAVATTDELAAPLEPKAGMTLKGAGVDRTIITRTTVTPRKEGLLGFNPGCNFQTIRIRDNLIECQGQSRPLLRCNESYG